MRSISMTRSEVRPIDSSASLSAGAIAGSGFLAVLLLFTPEPIWMPLQREASLFVVGPSATNAFSPGLMAIGLAVHFASAVAVSSAIDSFVRFLKLAPAILAGAVIGAVLYVCAAVVFVAWAPWVASAMTMQMFAAYVIFGMCSAGAYEGIEDEHEARRHDEEMME
jgi:hypothetical protein